MPFVLRSFLVALWLCSAALLFAQPEKPKTKVLLQRDRMQAQWDTVNCVKNVIKINPLLFFRGEIPVYFERALSPRLSAELGLGLTYRNYITLPIDGDDADEFSAGTKLRPKPSFHFGARYYLMDDLEPQGTYLQVEFAYLNYTKDQDTKDSLGQFTGINLTDERIFNDVRLLFGYQSLGTTSNLLFDFYGGLGLRSRSLQIVKETVNTQTNAFTYVTEESTDVVPAFFLGVKVGMGW
jgi:hypothetical protein